MSSMLRELETRVTSLQRVKLSVPPWDRGSGTDYYIIVCKDSRINSALSGMTKSLDEQMRNEMFCLRTIL
jgi:hypothetical protein